MKKNIALIGLFAILNFQFPAFNPVQAQKPKSVEFTTDGLPDQLLEYMNKQENIESIILQKKNGY